MHPTRTSVNDNIILIYKNVSSLKSRTNLSHLFQAGFRYLIRAKICHDHTHYKTLYNLLLFIDLTQRFHHAVVTSFISLV